MAHFFLDDTRVPRVALMIGMLNCMARWYSTPGSLARCVGPLPPYASLAVGIAAGVVHTKWVCQFRSVHSIWHPSPSKRAPSRARPLNMSILSGLILSSTSSHHVRLLEPRPLEPVLSSRLPSRASSSQASPLIMFTLSSLVLSSRSSQHVRPLEPCPLEPISLTRLPSRARPLETPAWPLAPTSHLSTRLPPWPSLANSLTPSLSLSTHLPP